MEKTARFYQASTSELYGKVQAVPQDETTPFYPRSPYAAAKLYAYWIMVNYREAYGMHASNGILFNHESPRRGETFVTRKITRAVAAIHLGQAGLPLARQPRCAARLGPCAGLRRGHVAHPPAATRPTTTCWRPGRRTRCAQFVRTGLRRGGIALEWRGKGVDEVGVDRATGRTLVRVDPDYFRPTEVDLLIGDPAKAKREARLDAYGQAAGTGARKWSPPTSP